MSKQKKDAKKETTSAASSENKRELSMSDLEQELLQSKPEETSLDADTLAALSSLAELEASFLSDSASEVTDADEETPEPAAVADEPPQEPADETLEQHETPEPVEDDPADSEETAVSSPPTPPESEQTENAKPDWLSDDMELYDFADELLDDDVSVVSEEELAQLLDEAAEELLDPAHENDLSELPSNILDDATDEVFDALFEEEASADVEAELVADEETPAPEEAEETVQLLPESDEVAEDDKAVVEEEVEEEPEEKADVVEWDEGEVEETEVEETAVFSPEMSESTAEPDTITVEADAPESETIAFSDPLDVEDATDSDAANEGEAENNSDVLWHDETLAELVADEPAEATETSEASTTTNEPADNDPQPPITEALEALDALESFDEDEQNLLTAAPEPVLENEDLAMLEALATASEPTAESGDDLEEVAEALDALAFLDEEDIDKTDIDDIDDIDVDDTSYLDDLIAAIDEEVEAVHGSSIMADLNVEQTAGTQPSLKQYVVFDLSGSTYAAPAAHVREVAQLASVTRIPNVPHWLLGVTNLRGDVLSLIGLRNFLGLTSNGQASNFSHNNRQVMVVRSEKHASSITTGLVVDEIQDIRYLDIERIDDLSAPINDEIAPYLQGVYEEEGHLLVLLDLEKLLLAPEMWQFDIV